MKERDPQCIINSVFFKSYNAVHGNKQFKLILKKYSPYFRCIVHFFLGPRLLTLALMFRGNDVEK